MIDRRLPARLLVALLLPLILATFGTGCCFFRRTFGMDRYVVRIKADEDANLGSDTEVLIIWPAEEHRSAIQNSSSLNEARDALRELTADDFTFAYFGTISPGSELEFDDDDDLVSRVNDRGELRWHCAATHGFVFTTMGPAEGPNHPLSLEGGPQSFTGYLEVRLMRERAAVEQLLTEEAWEAQRTRRVAE